MKHNAVSYLVSRLKPVSVSFAMVADVDELPAGEEGSMKYGMVPKAIEETGEVFRSRVMTPAWSSPTKWRGGKMRDDFK